MPNPPGLVDEVLAVLEPCPNPWCEADQRDGDFRPDFRLHHFGNYRVVCPSCTCEGPLRRTKADAATAWNTRDLHTRLSQGCGEDGLREALDRVRDAMLNGGDGTVGDFGWSITKLNKARPLIRAALSATQQQREGGWRDIASAPYKQDVEVRAGRMTFLARLMPDEAMTSSEHFCDQWVASFEDEHPPCWSDGRCWASNEDGNASLQPTAWRVPAPPLTLSQEEQSHDA